MNVNDGFRSALDALCEPALLVALDSQIVHRNRSATKLDSVADRTYLARPGEATSLGVLAFLATCCRSAREVRGSVNLSGTSEVDAIALPCVGARVRLQPDGPLLVLLRFLPCGTDQAPFGGRRTEKERIRLLIRNTKLQERMRVARDLHDQTGQQMLGLKLEIQRLRRTCSSSNEISIVDNLIGQVDTIMRDLRNTIVGLRPVALSEVGFVQALRNAVGFWSASSGIASEFRITGEPDVLSIDREVALYRLLQESLTNIAKHAVGVSFASVSLVFEDGVATISVRDDGKKVTNLDDAECRGNRGQFGLIGMRERITSVGGRIEVRSKGGRDHGTTVVASLQTGVSGRRREGGKSWRPKAPTSALRLPTTIPSSAPASVI